MSVFILTTTKDGKEAVIQTFQSTDDKEIAKKMLFELRKEFPKDIFFLYVNINLLPVEFLD